MVMEHRKKEEKQGGSKIWPATPEARTSKDLEEEEKFCSLLEAASCMVKPELTW